MSDKNGMPDVAFDAAGAPRALDAVGMEHVALPVSVNGVTVAADVDVFVDLADASRRGIHMSRMYLVLQEQLAGHELDSARLANVMAALVQSQQGTATRATLSLRFAHLMQRKALVSDHQGWKSYPVTLEVTANGVSLDVQLRVEIAYSSTCPASAALSRQLNAQAFAEHFGARDQISAAEVSAWLESASGMAATPHAQRSIAEVAVGLEDGFAELPLLALVDAVEAALGTPVQTAVKREDEQAFARANAENLMFCEDAARRVASALDRMAGVRTWRAKLAHLESLHAHDAVAIVSSGNAR